MLTYPSKPVKEYVMASNGKWFKIHNLTQSQCKVLQCFIQAQYTHFIFLCNYVWHESVDGKISAVRVIPVMCVHDRPLHQSHIQGWLVLMGTKCLCL